jgi:DNA-binding GntR family transcriptional regulator
MAGKGKTRTDPVQRALRADILSGALAPGAPLRIAALAEQYGVSYSVVREVLLRLEGQGLTRAVAQKGFTVAPVSREDLLELTQVRQVVEGRAFRESIEAGDLAWESEVISCMHRLARLSEGNEPRGATSEEWAQAHAEFHHALISACPNRRLLELSTQLRDASEMYRQLSLLPAGAAPVGEPRDLLAEHQQLADHALARRVDDGVLALERHLQVTTDFTLARYFGHCCAGEGRDPA